MLKYFTEEDMEKVRNDLDLFTATTFKFVEYFRRPFNSKPRAEGRYEFIPYDFIGEILANLRAIKNEFQNDWVQPTFVDAGSGIGVYPYLASRLGFIATGIEIEPSTCKISCNLFSGRFTQNPTFKKKDIMRHSYRDYDVVYYYCPFYDRDKQRKFELKVEKELKVGGYIIPREKADHSINDSPSFEKFRPGVYRKIK